MRPDSRFGTVPFTMIRSRGSEAPDWTMELRIREFPIPGSNTVEVQVMGQARLKLSVTLHLECARDFSALMALLGTEATLQMPYTATAYPGDRDGQDIDGLYKAFDSVLLTIPSGAHPRLHRNGAVDIDVQFSREAAS